MRDELRHQHQNRLFKERRKAERSPVTIVRPTHKHDKLVGAALGRRLSQTDRPLDIIILDDSSADATARLIVGCRGRDSLRHERAFAVDAKGGHPPHRRRGLTQSSRGRT